MASLSFLENKLVYHGSNVEVKNIELGKCRPRRDFGVAFYLTTSEKQAISWAKTKKNRFKSNKAVLNVFRVISFGALEHESKIFPYTNEEWLDFILFNRFAWSGHEFAPFHVVFGPVADDDADTVLSLYLQGAYDHFGVEKVSATISFLETKNLVNQLALCTMEAVACVKHVRSTVL